MAQYSIIVPAYKECGNLKPLTEGIFKALEQDQFRRGVVELIIVDDNSNDGSVETVAKLKQAGYPVNILVRTKERGLSSAVIHGFHHSRGDFFLVMDADLQHPPEYVPKLLRAFEKNRGKVEFVLGTRYGAGVKIDESWPIHRRVISWGARVLARPLTPLSDPMSGFFAIRRDVFVRGEKDVSAIGYKIALELFVKCRVRHYEEVGFSFAARTIGESKLTGKVIVHYLKHLRTLYIFEYMRWMIYLLVALVILTMFLLRSPLQNLVRAIIK
jgi:dolichol-phosphate mannosyltransferase